MATKHRAAATIAEATTVQSALLVEDPDLALGVPPGERARAERAVVVPLVEARAGRLTLEEPPEGPTLGILLLSGFVVATTALAEQSSDQLLGPGHIVQTGPAIERILPVRCTYDALTPVRFAVLDRRFIAAVRLWPGLLIALHARLQDQQRQLAVHAAIGRLRRSEDRILAVLWQIAEQWGHRTSDGVTVPVRLTHEALGRLAGASRSTTTLALATLQEEGRLRRPSVSEIILDPDPAIPLKRAMDQAPRRPRGGAMRSTADRTRADRAALLERVAALQGTFDDQVRNVDEILAASRESAARNAETRRRVRVTRDASGHVGRRAGDLESR